ncbi:MAG TPA: UDP-2,3-diacylglucosamine diphosphatase LpxI [Candidatus Megaira endosymbiont of Hartmannula sinica]|nr:UDP-2,3-diacylglucosamine diphosphatase LpxI [Candidatus Megaera endosymbiont of Hartmannula sinica]
MKNKTIAVMAGGGNFPLQLISSAIKKGLNIVIADISTSNNNSNKTQLLTKLEQNIKTHNKSSQADITANRTVKTHKKWYLKNSKYHSNIVKIINFNNKKPKQQNIFFKVFNSLFKHIYNDQAYNPPPASKEKTQKIIYNQFNIGKVGAISKYLKEHQIKEVVIIGKINRPNLTLIKTDLQGKILLSKIIKEKYLGDNKILFIIEEYINSLNIKVLSPQYFLGKTEIISDLKPTDNQIQDIKIGKNFLKHISDYDIGQSLVINDGYIIAIEAAEGTDRMINRAGSLMQEKNNLNDKKGIVVKIAKVNQNKKIDLPSIGPQTIENIYQNNMQGIAVDKKNIIITEQKKVIKLINKYKLFLYYI